MLIGRYNCNHRTNAPSEPIMINESDCSRDFSKEMTKKYRDTHKKIRNCNEFDNSLNFSKISPGTRKTRSGNSAGGVPRLNPLSALPEIGLPNGEELSERCYRRSHQSSDGCLRMESETMAAGNFLALFPMAKTANLSDFLMEIKLPGHAFWSITVFSGSFFRTTVV